MGKIPYVDTVDIPVYLPLVNNGKVVCVVSSDYKLSYVQTLYRDAYLTILIAVMLSVVLSGFVAWRISLFLIKPIKEVAHSAGQLAKANFDIAIPITSHNEISEQQKALRTIRDNLKEMMHKLNGHIQKLDGISQNFKDVRQKSFDTITIIINNMGMFRVRLNFR
ncbi:MAG: hypothetical protein LBB80_10295 [Treponema sp.]|jgi:methyl-accepting chemotaxis protein|nr:hypothetical protein [Treponema sp.]